MSLAPVTIQQSLFGYDDGHRLLASSRPISRLDTSLLLLASDLTPGMRSSSNVDYWTGFQLADEPSYALMRTWAAPEISRPGCVWTHVLRIPSAELGRFEDLAVLRSQCRRPDWPSDFAGYREVLSVAPVRGAAEIDGLAFSARVFELLEILYDEPGGSMLGWRPKTEDAIFAVWSQQWPRLRQSFSFRSGVGLQGAPKDLNLDLQIVDRSIPMPETLVPERPKGWINAAMRDIFEGGSPLRRFLWRYGSDVRQARQSFARLVELYQGTRVDSLEGAALRVVLEDVTLRFPTQQDANLLKSDLVGYPLPTYSLLPLCDPIEVRQYFCRRDDSAQWPLPPTLPEDLLAQALQKRPQIVLEIASACEHNRHESDIPLIRQIGETFDAGTFWSLTHDKPAMRRLFSQYQPTLLDHADFAELDAEEIVDYLLNAELPPQLLQRLIRRLLGRSDPDLVELVWERFQDFVVDDVLQALNGATGKPAPPWLELISEHPETWLRPAVMSRVYSTRCLRELASRLDPESAGVRAAGPILWAEAMTRAASDYRQNDFEFLIFLLVLALDQPQRGVETLFQRAFEVVHQGIEHSRIPPKQFDLLMRHLPSLPYWKDWDNCYRLSLGVATACVRGQLNSDAILGALDGRFVRRQFPKALKRASQSSLDWAEE